MADEDGEGLRDRLSRQGEEALGKLASDLLENPLVNSAITRAFSAREKAVHAQEAAMGALNLPSAADIDRLTRRLRTVGTRLEGIEEALDRLQDGVDQLSDRLEAVGRGSEPGVADRVAAVEGQLSKLVNEVGAVSIAIDARPPRSRASRNGSPSTSARRSRSRSRRPKAQAGGQEEGLRLASAASATRPISSSAASSSSAPIRSRVATMSETTSRQAAAQAVAGGDREQRRRLHLDRDARRRRASGRRAPVSGS